MSTKLKSDTQATKFLSFKHGLKIDDWTLFYNFEQDIYLSKSNKVETVLASSLVIVSRNATGQAQTMTRSGERSIAAANTARKWKINNRYGLLVEDSRANYFLNSAAPVSQTVAVPSSTNPIVISCIGSGSVSVSGDNLAASAVITESNPQVFYPKEIKAHNINVVCTGTLTHVQVEIAGGHANASSPITTTTASVARSRDTVSVNNDYFAQALGTSKVCTVVVQTIPHVILDTSKVSTENQLSLYSSTTSQIFIAQNQQSAKELQKAKLDYVASNVIVSSKLSENTSKQKWGNVTAFRISANEFSVASGGVLSESVAITAGYTPNILYIGTGYSSPIGRAGLHGIVTKLAVFPRVLTDDEMKEITKSWN